MTKKVATYKAAHRGMKSMSERELRDAMQAEIDKGPEARVDLLTRLIGRFNRKRGARCQRDILGLLSKRGRKDVDATLDNHG